MTERVYAQKLSATARANKNRYNRELYARKRESINKTRRLKRQTPEGKEATARDIARHKERRRENPEVAERDRAKGRRWYANHREKRLEAQRVWQRKRRAELRAIVARNKQGKTCSKCPEATPVCLDFHHTDPGEKIGPIAMLAGRLYPPELLQAEIDKCILLCANCHRKLHHDR